MKITFLGTSAGIPTKQRNVTAIAVQPHQQADWWLVDCGEGTQHQLLHTSLSLSRLTTIFITHLHGDHCYGLPGLLATRALQGGSQNIPLTLIGPAGIKALIEGICHHTQLYLNYPLTIIEVNSIPTTLTIDQHQIDVVPMEHNITSYGYLISPPDIPGHLDAAKAKALGIPPGPIYQQLKQGKQVILEDGREIDGSDLLSPTTPAPKVLIAGDNANPQQLLPWLKSVSLLIHESTLTEPELLRLATTIHHSTAAAVAKVANQAKLANLILTHFSARYRDSSNQGKLTINDIRQEASKHFHGQLFLAEDWQQYTLTTEGKLLLTQLIQKPNNTPAINC
ncbi:ribonuclease Z [Endozoicomonas sp. SM1973]|uniref:Ribonuclease Z n=1 Tax=Spartinivicinus marinus TaxID=2994442 RepID=A0A853IDZ1_9GAMM|nr:ribonuclease Z [Spartinivicinus marinus]MCX4029107.1 ribonuclease Z [Spartinivicinus marinus]NYZ67727.1 ribonuclease Z [Spartinivicinus marinus]